MTYKKVDNNQTEIVKHLRKLGATVQILSAIGKGCPDLLVGWNGSNLLMEVKVKKGKLTPDQVVWFEDWCGYVSIVRTTDDVDHVLSYYA